MYKNDSSYQLCVGTHYVTVLVSSIYLNLYINPSKPHLVLEADQYDPNSATDAIVQC